MRPIDPPLCNVIMGKEQEEYYDLPAYASETKTITCWELSTDEMAEVKRTGKIYLAQYNQGNPLQPVAMALMVEDVYEVEEIKMFKTYHVTEIFSLDDVRLVDSPCPVCGAMPGDPCLKGILNDTDVLYKRVHQLRMKT
jgi:hypothetical protein